MKKALFLIFILLMSACNTLDPAEDSDALYIRVANSSPIDFNSVYLSFPGAEHTFGPIKSGRSSPYQKFEQAYRYGFIEVKSDHKSYVLQPIDYVGETPLKNGRYTFELDIQDNHVTLNNKRD